MPQGADNSIRNSASQRAIRATLLSAIANDNHAIQITLDGVETLFLHEDALLLTSVRDFATAFGNSRATERTTLATTERQPDGNFAATPFPQHRPRVGTRIA
jgi:hypothetical protein